MSTQHVDALAERTRIRPRRARTGSAYAIVLILAGVVSTVALGGLAMRRATSDRATITLDATAAMALARSSVELALLVASELPPGAEAKDIAGVWFNKRDFGPGTISATVETIDQDAVVSLNLLGLSVQVGAGTESNYVTLVGEGRVGNARRRLGVTLERLQIPEYRDRAIDAGAESHWPLDEGSLQLTATEIVDGEHGAYSTLLVAGAVPARDGGLAPGFSSTAAYLNLPGDAFPQPQGTVALWVRRGANAPAAGTILRAGFTDTPGLVLEVAGERLCCKILGTSRSRTTLIGPSLVKGQWHHVVAVFSENGAALYLNGQAVASSPTKLDDIEIDDDANLIVGADRQTRGASISGPLGGAVRELSFFSSALTQQEVTALYADGLHQNSQTHWRPVPSSWRPIVDR